MPIVLEKNVNGRGNGTAPGVTFPQTPAAGDIIAFGYHSALLTADIDDTGWTVALQDDDSSGGHSIGVLLQVADGAGASFAFSQDSGLWEVQGWRVSGLDTNLAAIIDKAPAAADPAGTGTSVQTTTTGVLSQADEFIIGIAGASGNVNALTPSVTETMTLRGTGTLQKLLAADKITAATTALAPTFSWLTTAFERNALIVTLKGGAAGGGGGGGGGDPIGAPIASFVAIRNQQKTIGFSLKNATDDLVPSATGLDPEISKDGAAFTNTAGGVTEVGGGFYKITLTAAEMDASMVMLNVKASNAKPYTLIMYPSNFYVDIGNSVLDQPIDEPDTTFSWGVANLRKINQHIGALWRNPRKVTTAGQDTVYHSGGTSSPIWARTITDVGGVLTINESGAGGGVVDPPEPGTGLKGWMGCSNMNGAIAGYQDLDGTQFWGGYDVTGATVFRWADAGDPVWIEFDAQLEFFNSDEPPSLILFMMCSHKQSTVHGVTTVYSAEMIRAYTVAALTNLRTRYSGPVQFSPINSYADGYGTASDGVAWVESDQACDMIVAAGHGVKGPLFDNAFLGANAGEIAAPGGIHPTSGIGTRRLGQFMIDKYGT